MAADNAVANGKPEACALPNRFRGKEWIKDLVEMLLRNADAIVLKLNSHEVLTVPHLGSRSNGENSRPAQGLHGVHRVNAHGEKDLAKFSIIANDLEETLRRVLCNPNLSECFVVAEQLKGLFESLVDADLLLQNLLVPTEIQQVADNAFAADDLVIDDIQILREIF